MFRIALCAIRESCGYTLNEVAEYCGTTVEAVKEMEDSPGDIMASMAMKLRALYGIPIDYINI